MWPSQDGPPLTKSDLVGTTTWPTNARNPAHPRDEVCLPVGSVVKNLPVNAGDAGSVPGLGRSPGEGNGNPPQCSCLANSMDRGAWWATVHGIAKELDMT